MISTGLRVLQVSKQHPAPTCGAVLCHAPLSKATQKRVTCLLSSHSQGLLGVLPMWIEYPHWSPHASAWLFDNILSIKYQSHGIALHIAIMQCLSFLNVLHTVLGKFIH